MQAPPRFGLQLKPRRAKSSLSGRIVVRLEFDPPRAYLPTLVIPCEHGLVNSLPLCTVFLPALSMTTSGLAGAEPTGRRVTLD